VASVAELAHGEKSRTHSVTHPAYLISREPKLALRKSLHCTWQDAGCLHAMLHQLQSPNLHCSTTACHCIYRPDN